MLEIVQGLDSSHIEEKLALAHKSEKGCVVLSQSYCND